MMDIRVAISGRARVVDVVGDKIRVRALGGTREWLLDNVLGAKKGDVVLFHEYKNAVYLGK